MKAESETGVHGTIRQTNISSGLHLYIIMWREKIWKVHTQCDCRTAEHNGQRQMIPSSGQGPCRHPSRTSTDLRHGQQSANYIRPHVTIFGCELTCLDRCVAPHRLSIRQCLPLFKRYLPRRPDTRPRSTANVAAGGEFVSFLTDIFAFIFIPAAGMMYASRACTSNWYIPK